MMQAVLHSILERSNHSFRLEQGTLDAQLVFIYYLIYKNKLKLS